MILGTLVVALCLVLALVLFIAQRVISSRASWHAELMVDEFDCSHPEICRMRPSESGSTGYAENTKFFTWTINRQGYRGVDRNEEKPRGLVRLQVYGDSMIFGSGVDEGETLPDQIEVKLRRALPHREVEVQNFGIPMSYLRSNLITYREFGRDYSPDMVLFWMWGNWFNAKDMNYRLQQIRHSAFLSAIRHYGWGRWLINTWQVGTMDLFVRSWAIDGLREQLELLARDQQERGTRVVFFNYFDEPDAISEVVPEGLEVTQLWAGLTMDEYRQWAIPDDGHPTSAGQAHFAEWLVESLLPELGDP